MRNTVLVLILLSSTIALSFLHSLVSSPRSGREQFFSPGNLLNLFPRHTLEQQFP